MRARGIHSHPTLKLGRQEPSRRAALRFDNYLTGQQPQVPVAVDHFSGVNFALDDNDKFGVCGPTGVDNLTRLISKGLTGKQVGASLEQVFDLYRRSGNPNFDPQTGEDDNGVDLQTMLGAFKSGGLGAIKPVCYGRISPHNDKAIDAAVAIFGGVLLGVTLQKSQQTQSQVQPPVWDYYAPHATWGGHCVMNGRYTSDKDGVISWKMAIDMTPRFRRHQLEEVWVVVYPWHLDHPAFLQGIDLPALERDYQGLTGQALPIAKKLDKLSRPELDALASEKGLDPKAYSNKQDLVAALDEGEGV